MVDSVITRVWKSSEVLKLKPVVIMHIKFFLKIYREISKVGTVSLMKYGFHSIRLVTT